MIPCLSNNLYETGKVANTATVADLETSVKMVPKRQHKRAVIDPEFGRRLEAERKAHGLSQEDLGKQIGVGKSAVSKYEKGRVPNPATLDELTYIFGKRLYGRAVAHGEINHPITPDKEELIAEVVRRVTKQIGAGGEEKAACAATKSEAQTGLVGPKKKPA